MIEKLPSPIEKWTELTSATMDEQDPHLKKPFARFAEVVWEGINLTIEKERNSEKTDQRNRKYAQMLIHYWRNVLSKTSLPFRQALDPSDTLGGYATDQTADGEFVGQCVYADEENTDVIIITRDTIYNHALETSMITLSFDPQNGIDEANGKIMLHARVSEKEKPLDFNHEYNITVTGGLITAFRKESHFDRYSSDGILVSRLTRINELNLV